MTSSQINETLEQLNMDSRLKILLATYFVGKNKTDNLSEEEFQSQLRQISNRVRNIELLDYPNIGVAYDSGASVLSISKNAFQMQKSEEMMALIFSKFEEVLDNNDYSQEARTGIVADRGEIRHAYYFLKGVEIAQSLNTSFSKTNGSV